MAKVGGRNWTQDELRVFSPPHVVPASEHIQIAAKIDVLVASLESSGVDLEYLVARVRKPLRPFWYTPSSSLPSSAMSSASFTPLVLVTASKQVADGIERMNGFTYFQG